MPSLCAKLAPPSLRMQWSDLEITNGGQEMSVRWSVCTGHVNGFTDKTWLTCTNFIYHTRKPPPPQQQQQQHQQQQQQPPTASVTSGPSKSNPQSDPASGHPKSSPDHLNFKDSPTADSHPDPPPAVQTTTIRMDTVEVGLLSFRFLISSPYLISSPISPPPSYCSPISLAH